jgi:Putative transposase
VAALPAHSGAVSVIQRGDSGLRLNVHFHVLALDGVYVREEPAAPLVFHPLPAPTVDEVADVAKRAALRVQKILERHGRSLDGSGDVALLQRAGSLLVHAETRAIERGIAWLVWIEKASLNALPRVGTLIVRGARQNADSVARPANEAVGASALRQLVGQQAQIVEVDAVLCGRLALSAANLTRPESFGTRESVAAIRE